MNGYPSIGSTYLLKDPISDKILVWAVIENNLNDQTSTVLVVDDCSENGKKAKVDAKRLYESKPLGLILPVAGNIVVEDGIEFVKPSEEKVQSKALKLKKTKR